MENFFDKCIITVAQQHSAPVAKPPALIDTAAVGAVAARLADLHEMRRAQSFLYVNRFILFLFGLAVWYVVQKCRRARIRSPMEKIAAAQLEKAKMEEMIRAIRISRKGFDKKGFSASPFLGNAMQMHN